MAATIGVLIGIAVVVSLIVLLIDRRAGPIRTLLTLAAAFAGAWAVNHFAFLLQQLVFAHVLIVPAVLGALVFAFLFRHFTQGVGGKRRVK